MLYGIDQYHEEIAKCQIIVLCFYEKVLILGRPLITQETFNRMIKSHYISLRIFSTSPKLKNIYSTNSCYGITCPFIVPKKVLESKPRRWFVPWGVFIKYPEENGDALKKSRQKALLSCPMSFEIPKGIRLFEKDEASNTLTHQVLTISAYFEENKILKRNLQQDPSPLYEQAIQEWSLHSKTDVVAKNPKNLKGIDFAPKPNQTLMDAYVFVLQSKKIKHRQNLRSRFRYKLEKHMLTDLPWSLQERIAFLKNLEAQILGLSERISKGRGRWKQDAGIDYLTAANFIEYFVKKFIGNSDDYKSGEIACILWILISCAQNGCDVTVDQVRNLTTKQITDTSRVLLFQENHNEISVGLHQLLLCLRGKEIGKRGVSLFKNVSKKSLERALAIASKEILPVGATPVLPAAFLVSPHVNPNLRISAIERQAIKNSRQLVPYRFMSDEILAMLKNTC